MSLFGNLPIGYQYAVVIGVPVVCVSLAVVLTCFITRRRMRAKTRNVQLQTWTDRDRGAGRFYADDKTPTFPAIDRTWTAVDKQEPLSRNPSRGGTLSPATLPPYGRLSPVHGAQYASEGVGGRSWPVDDVYFKSTPVPPSPALSGYRDRDYARSPNLYSDVAPPAFESRPGTARPVEKIDLSSPIPPDAGMRSPGFRRGITPPQEIEMRSPIIRPGTAPLAISSRSRSDSTPKPPTPRLIPRPGTAAPRMGTDSRPPLTVIGRSVELEGSPAGDGKSRLHSARRAATSPSGQSSGSVSSQGSTRSQHSRMGNISPRQVIQHPQTRTSPSPPLASSSLSSNDDDNKHNNNYHDLANERHRPTPLDFTALNEPRRAATASPRAPPHDASSTTYEVSIGRAQQSPWGVPSPTIRPGTAAPGGGGGGTSSPILSRREREREWPRSPSSRIDLRQQQQQAQANHGVRIPPEDESKVLVPLALRPGYPPSQPI
ncbi:MAG: peptide transporter ptr2 [Watsoniomyces obsoletus]|nr:MAG: peptide transporter ptr2 [Watsoniomyces obsoletus]